MPIHELNGFLLAKTPCAYFQGCIVSGVGIAVADQLADQEGVLAEALDGLDDVVDETEPVGLWVRAERLIKRWKLC